ncbi:DUF1146 family protein [Paenibacillus sp. YYML68]|uniref:DUF1146 family protein n=1 Tax=Paenibacillus sp. YYML68 TaxID=2909250 RepID=UPI0024933121|nr:DUF1146 family protein [Paenibacillus sp. YYML68]
MDYVDQLNASLGLKGILNILLVLMFIGLSWWVLQELKLEQLFKRPRGMRAKLLHIMLSVVLGYEITRFVIDYLAWSQWLSGMF